MEAAKKAGWAIGTTPPPKSYDPVIMYPRGAPRPRSERGVRRPNAPLPSQPREICIKRPGACWGEEVQFPNLPPEGSFRSIAAGDGYTCGVKSDGSLVCWSLYDSGENNLPRGTFEAVAAGPGHTCALRTDGSVACWGDHGAGQSSPLGGAFLAIATGGSHSCGVRSNGSVACWGLNENEQCVPPADLQVPTTP